MTTTPNMAAPTGSAKKADARTTTPRKAQGPRTDPALITKTNKVGFPIGAAVPEDLRKRVGMPVAGRRGYFVRYPYATYDLAAKVGDKVEGQAWMVVCRHGNTNTADSLMGEGGVEKLAAARKTWCAECAEGTVTKAEAQAKAAKAVAKTTARVTGESAEAKAERHQAKAVRDADLAAKKAEEAKITGARTAKVIAMPAKKAEAVEVDAAPLPYLVRNPLAEMPEVGAQVAVVAHQTDKVGTVVKVGRTIAEVEVPMGNGGTKVVKRHLAEMGPVA